VWVVKLGGSLAHDPALRAWVSVLVACPDPVVIVPGGGPFADEVRRLQRTWLFDDVRAHALALRAMDLFGEVLCALHPDLRPLESLDAWNTESREPATRVWVPSRDVLADASVEASWDITSDSLSAWLARRVRARGLLLVKSAEPRTEDTDLVSLVREGLVDRAFEQYGPRAGCPIGLLHRDRADQFGGWLAGRPGCGHIVNTTVSNLEPVSGHSR
jgi:aspartokinase-like uncharacterized kinase